MKLLGRLRRGSFIFGLGCNRCSGRLGLQTNVGEIRELLSPAVFVNLKLLRTKINDLLTTAIRDHGVNLDQVSRDADNFLGPARRRLSLLLRGNPALLAGDWRNQC